MTDLDHELELAWKMEEDRQKKLMDFWAQPRQFDDDDTHRNHQEAAEQLLAEQQDQHAQEHRDPDI